MSNQRLTFIDVLRGIACIWMIETHALNAFMDSSYRSGLLFSMLQISNGFVAVTFIFCAGAGFRLALQSKLESYITISAPLMKYIRRLLFILGMGYILQTPAFSLMGTIESGEQGWTKLFQSNVLHLIVASSFIGLGLLALMRSTQKMRNAVWAMLIGIFWLTPFVWSLKPDAIQWIPLCFRMFIVPQPLSPFPIFPWAGYYFAGYLATEYFLSAKNPKKAARYMLVAVLVIVVGVYLSSQSVWTYYPDGMNWWLVSPAHMFMRISGALTLFAGLYLLQQRMTGRISAFLSLEGKESLVVYVGQGIILYGETLNRKLHVYLPKPVTPLTILLLTLSVIAIMGIYSAYWHKYKQSMPRHAQWSLYLASSVTVLLFLFS